MREGSTTPSRRHELSSMADDYARHALSQHAAFEANEFGLVRIAEADSVDANAESGRRLGALLPFAVAGWIIAVV